MSTSSPAPRRRISITKLQRDSAAAVELVALTESLTADGRLDETEVEQLKAWVEWHRGSGLPALAHIEAVILKITADGTVTREELDELYQAIVAVLPPDLRTPVAARDRAVKREEDARAREEKARARAAQREEEMRNRAVAGFNFMVAGVPYADRAETIARSAGVDSTVYLRREPTNAHDRNATLVLMSDGAAIGYVPAKFAGALAEQLDAGHPYEAYITKILTGGRLPTPVVQATFYGIGAEVEGLVQPGTEPALTSGSSTPSLGCLPVLALLVGGVAALNY